MGCFGCHHECHQRGCSAGVRTGLEVLPLVTCCISALSTRLLWRRALQIYTAPPDGVIFHLEGGLRARV